jgi:hypothetical protein
MSEGLTIDTHVTYKMFLSVVAKAICISGWGELVNACEL